MAGNAQALKYENTLAVLNMFGQEVVEAYKSKVLEYNALATRNLLTQVSANVPTVDGSHIIVSINLMPYWKFVEAGRQAGKMPPVDAIEEWVKHRPDLFGAGNTRRGVPSYSSVTPRLDDLSVNTDTRNIAWAVATNIKKYGIDPKPMLAPSVRETMKNFRERIAEALAKDVGGNIGVLMGNLWSDVDLAKDNGQWIDREVITDLFIL